MSTVSDPSLPDITAPGTAPFWEGTTAGELRIQRCDTCGYLRWPPGPMCPECLTAGATWTDVPAAGTVWSWATYHRAMDPAFKDDIPYTVVLVELAAGPRMYGRYTGDAESLHAGQSVHGEFRDVGPGVVFIDWKPEQL